jgi:hypothetical protein
MDDKEKIDPRSYREIEQLCVEIANLQERLAEILAQQQDFPPDGAHLIRRATEQVIEEARRRADQTLRMALARINFRDDRYRFLRAIDGDTLEVAPPRELSEWMRDIHVRLYGVDTPERGQERASFYTELLESLCTIDRGAISVIWERERRGTEYAGFPLSSFERGIGNVFVELPDTDGRVLYVNAFLASFPDVQLVRDDKPLLRGARILRAFEDEWPHFLWHRNWWPYPHWFWRRFRRISFDLDPASVSELREFACSLGRECPRCLPWVLPRSAFADPDGHSLALREQLAGLLRECGCPGCRRLGEFFEADLPLHLEKERVSVYDVLLLLARGPRG